MIKLSFIPTFKILIPLFKLKVVFICPLIDVIAFRFVFEFQDFPSKLFSISYSVAQREQRDHS
jgi:hypothetical protein